MKVRFCHGGFSPSLASRFMNQSETNADEASKVPQQKGYSARLLELQRREWWTWGLSVLVMLMLTAGVASLAFPIMEEGKSLWASGVFQAVAGLVFMIIIFGCFLTYEKILLKRFPM